MFVIHPANSSLRSRDERSFEDALGYFAAIIWALALLQFLREQLLRAGSADSRHRLHLKFIWDAQLDSCAFIIEAFHSVHGEVLPETLQSEIFPCRASVVGVSDGWFVIVIECLSRNEQDEDGGILRP